MDFGRGSLINLVLGMVLLFLCVSLVLISWSYFDGVAPGGDITIKHESISNMLSLWALTVFCGSLGGFVIGRSVEKDFSERNSRKQQQT